MASEQSTPKALGDYLLITKIASGGMASVYVGCRRSVAGFERLVAIKCCHPHLRDSEEFVSMFLDEARLAAGIHHPNVVGTLDVSAEDTLYLVMEYVEGPNLIGLVKGMAKAGKRVPIGVAVHIMKDVLSGLQSAHELRGNDGQLLNLVHRDVSPHNILVGLDGVSRITDFGIAFAAVRSTMTQEGRIKGKFSYIAPEQILAGRKVTCRMDIFSAGIVLWETLTSRPLFRRTTDAETVGAVISDEAPPPSKYNKYVTPELDAIVLKALTKDPEERYQTASEFREALEALAIPECGDKAVTKVIQEFFGEELSERRNKVRTLPQIPIDSPSTPSGVRTITTVPAGPVSKNSESKPVSILPANIEHKRMRALLAAVMLLLVGGAIGLLLNSRSPDPKPQQQKPISGKHE